MAMTMMQADLVDQAAAPEAASVVAEVVEQAPTNMTQHVLSSSTPDSSFMDRPPLVSQQSAPVTPVASPPKEAVQTSIPARSAKCKPSRSSAAPEENATNYKAGGFARLSPGMRLNNERYEVVRKLGVGAFAVVWLCWDLL